MSDINVIPVDLEKNNAENPPIPDAGISEQIIADAIISENTLENVNIIIESVICCLSNCFD